MLVLSFRDMSVPARGAVTTAAAYWIDPGTAPDEWAPEPANLKLAGWDETQKALQGKHVCFLVHGFNVDRPGGVTGLGAMAEELTGGGALVGANGVNLGLNVDVVVPVLWAGDWYLPVNYPFLLPDIRLTAKHFAEFIWSRASQMSRVSFITHSMGARVVMETVQRAVADAAQNGVQASALPTFDTVVLTAGAIPDDCLDLPDFAAAVGNIRKIVVVSSASDTVLSEAFPFGNAVEEALWPHDHGRDIALGRDGPRLSPASAARGKTTWFEIDRQQFQRHDDYLPSPLQAPPAPEITINGWTRKRINVGLIAQSVFNGTPPPVATNPAISTKAIP